MAKVIIFGSGRGSDQAFRYISKDSPHEIHGFTVDKKYKDNDEFNDLPLVAFEDIVDKFPPDEYKLFAPLGFQNMNRTRYKKYTEGKQKGYDFISYVSSSIPRIEELDIGENCFILENQSINLDVKIGNNVVMWSGNQVGDYSVIMDHCWISSHVCIAGYVVIKPYCIIGINATIANDIIIEEECFIGANALITQNTEPKGVYIVQGTKKSPMASDKFIAMLDRY